MGSASCVNRLAERARELLVLGALAAGIGAIWLTAMANGSDNRLPTFSGDPPGATVPSTPTDANSN